MRLWGISPHPPPWEPCREVMKRQWVWIKETVWQRGGFAPLLFSNNNFGPPFSCNVRSIHYSVELFMVADYFKQNWHNAYRRSGPLSGPKGRKCSRGSLKTGAMNQEPEGPQPQFEINRYSTNILDSAFSSLGGSGMVLPWLRRPVSLSSGWWRSGWKQGSPVWCQDPWQVQLFERGVWRLDTVSGVSAIKILKIYPWMRFLRG